jgi:hypothetical protein
MSGFIKVLGCIAMATLFISLANSARAGGPIFSESEDTELVHQLAHFGAGTLVAIVPDFVLTRFPQGSWERAWYSRLAIDCATAIVATDLYEAQTNKSIPTRLEHDADGGLGAAVLVGASVSWTFR